MTTRNRQGFYAQLPRPVIAAIRAEARRLKCPIWAAATSLISPAVYRKLSTSGRRAA